MKLFSFSIKKRQSPFSFPPFLINFLVIALILMLSFGCKKSDSAPPPTIPTVTTAALTNVTTSSATAGGTIVSNGNAAITQSGIVWSKTNTTPGLTDSVIAGSTSSGSFTTNLTGLDFNTVYYIRAFATNKEGTGYGNVVTLNTANDTSKVRFTYNGNVVVYGIIISPTTGKKWLDRNLGATQVATALDDYKAYGDLFQWGRPADGHQLINWTDATTGTAVNGTTTVLATSDIPGHSNFIIMTLNPFDWRDDNNSNRWVTNHQGPCPSGWHVPTQTEWAAEIYYNDPIVDNSPNTGGTATTGGIKDQGSAYSLLKLPSAGRRNSDASISAQTIGGYYYSASDIVGSSRSDAMYGFFSSNAIIGAFPKVIGMSVRCIKD